MSDLINQVIAGRYRIETFLGKGGMAEVYKVWDQNRSVHLAIKILHADLAEDKIFLRRFRREAQTLARLQHPNIVRFYGLEKDGDLVFMLMEYVKGTTLRKKIFESEGAFSLQRVGEILRPICAALNYAHQLGFVHCDIKPSNIMLNTNGTILIADFGIARMTEAATITMVGAGTPAYMAPEQARGENPMPQSDIYALGIILFEMLTGGERPFTGEHASITGSTSEKIRWEQLNVDPPSPRKFNSQVSSDLSNIILKCLDKDPKDRYDNALGLLSAFEQCVTISEKQADAFSFIRKDESKKKSIPGADAKSHATEKVVKGYEGFLERFLPKLDFFWATFNNNVVFSNIWQKKWIWAIAIAIIIGNLLYFSGIFRSSALSDAGALYFTSNRDGKAEIYMLIGKDVVRVTHTNGTAESWSPILSNAGALYFTSNRDGKAEIYMLIGKDAVRVTHTNGTAESWILVPKWEFGVFSVLHETDLKLRL